MQTSTDPSIPWLLEGDPSIRWQTLRDLEGTKEEVYTRERRRVESDGWGARLLALQGPEGTWASGQSSDDGLYLPKWISTTYTMLLLRDFGLPPTNRQARKACKQLLDGGLQQDGGINFGPWASRVRRGEACVTGMEEAIEMVRSARTGDGRWPLQNSYRGKEYFKLERVGAPSRWNTLRALRVLRWWENQ